MDDICEKNEVKSQLLEFFSSKPNDWFNTLNYGEIVVCLKNSKITLIKRMITEQP